MFPCNLTSLSKCSEDRPTTSISHTSLCSTQGLGVTTTTSLVRRGTMHGPCHFKLSSIIIAIKLIVKS